jgi:hypothetical protein
VSGNSSEFRSKTVRVSASSVPLTEYYVDVLHYSLGLALTPTYKESEKRTFNLQFRISMGTNKVEVAPQQWDGRDPCR